MPSCRYARVVSPIGTVGKSAKQIEMSMAVMTSSTALTKFFESNVPSALRNFIRFNDARLHELLSRLMYSEHGLDALIRPVSGLVCQSLMVSSYWMPGSAHSQAAWVTLRKRSLASMVSMTEPSWRARRPNSVPSSTARMNSSETRTELLAFWYWTLVMSLPPRSMSYPASRSARILFSSRALVSMNSSISGWSMSRTTIFAARRVAPPDLMVPALASAPRMNETGPDAVPPELSSSLDDRIRDRLRPAPEPPLKMKPSSRYQFKIESIESSTERMKQALTCCGEAVPTLNQTGELNEKYWCSNIQVSSCSKISADSVSAKYPKSSPALRYVLTTRSISCRSPSSRAGVPSAPRKYLVVTIVEALTLQKSGNSTPCCSKTTSPVFQLVCTTSRRSQVTSAYGCTPVVKTRSMVRPADLRGDLFASERPFVERVVSVICASFVVLRPTRVRSWAIWVGWSPSVCGSGLDPRKPSPAAR